MKKSIFLSLLMCLSVVGMQAQTLTSYKCDFEDPAEMQHWVINAGTRGASSTNKWYVGSGASFGVNSSNGLYVATAADTAANGYDASTGGYVVAYREMTLAQGNYTLMCDWLLQGQEADAIYVCWLPATTATNSNYSTAPGGGTIAVPSFLPVNKLKCRNSPFWQSASVRLNINSTNAVGKVVVVFYYTKGNSLMPGPAIDNLEIIPGSCSTPSSAQYDIHDFHLTWSGDSMGLYDVMTYETLSRTSVMYSGVVGTSMSFANMLDWGHYFFYVRQSCDSISHSSWVCTEGIGWKKGDRCIDYLDLQKAICYYGPFMDPAGSTSIVGVIDYGYASVESHHTIHYLSGEGDPRTKGELLTVPEGEIASVRLGNWEGEAFTDSLHGSSGATETIEYPYTVVGGVNDILILDYAVLLMDNHHVEDPEYDARFILEILDETNNKDGGISDTVFAYNFAQFSNDSVGMIGWNKVEPDDLPHVEGVYNFPIIWKPWTKSYISLHDYIGRTLTIRLTTKDCYPTGHWCYAYFTLNCAGGELQGMSCVNSDVTTFRAPEGFYYMWYKPSSPSVILSTADSLQISPTDTCIYYVDLISKDNIQTIATLVADPNPREPVAAFNYTVAMANGEHVVTFQNASSVVRTNRQTGQSYIDTTETSMVCDWDFGDGSVLNDNNSKSVIHNYPAIGGTYTVKQIVRLSGDACIDTLQQILTLPNLMENGIADSADYCVQYVDSKGRIHTADEVMYIDTLAINRYGFEATGYHYAFIHPSYEHVDSVRICDGVSYHWDVTDKYYKNDVPVTTSTDYIFDTIFESRMGCDSLNRLVLTVDPGLMVRFVADTFDYCPDNQILEMYYNIMSGVIDTVTLSVESRVEPFVIGEKHPQFAPNVPVSISLSNDLRPDVYEAYVDFSSELCQADPITVPFKTRYPSSILIVGDDNIALSDSEHNGGYHWSSYQWYCNYVPVPGATQPFLSTSKENIGDVYFVGLVREGETEVFYTCPIQYNGSQTDMEETEALIKDQYSKYLYNGHLYIVKGGRLYDALGREQTIIAE